MFEEISRLADEAARCRAEVAVVTAEEGYIAAQKDEHVLDGRNQIATENNEYAHTLRELGQAIGFSTVVDQLDTKMRHVPGLEELRPHSAELSWVPSAMAMTAEDGSPEDGVRAIYGWRTHWNNLGEDRPPEAVVALYSQQHKGEVLPPQATVFSYKPAKNWGKGSREFVDLLAKNSFLYEEYSPLRKLAETPYDELPQADRLAVVAGAKTIVATVRAGGLELQEYVSAFNDLKSHYREMASRNEAALVYGYKSAAWNLRNNQHLSGLIAQYQEEGYQDPTKRFPRYTSDQLVAINALFAQPVLQSSLWGYSLAEGRSWKNFATKLAKAEEVQSGGPANQNAWTLPPDARALNPVLEQDKIAERLQKIILSSRVH